jgi:hypothetical protein
MKLVELVKLCSVKQNEVRKVNIFLIVRCEVFTAVTMKNCVFCVVMPCGSYKRTSVASCSLCCS